LLSGLEALRATRGLTPRGAVYGWVGTQSVKRNGSERGEQAMQTAASSKHVVDKHQCGFVPQACKVFSCIVAAG